MLVGIHHIKLNRLLFKTVLTNCYKESRFLVNENRNVSLKFYHDTLAENYLGSLEHHPLCEFLNHLFLLPDKTFKQFCRLILVLNMTDTGYNFSGKSRIVTVIFLDPIKDDC